MVLKGGQDLCMKQQHCKQQCKNLYIYILKCLCKSRLVRGTWGWGALVEGSRH